LATGGQFNQPGARGNERGKFWRPSRKWLSNNFGVASVVGVQALACPVAADTLKRELQQNRKTLACHRRRVYEKSNARLK
jgi:hypothetical protein